jgi:prepilin-type N-terminal cleavage/methylation domain-containing protein
MSRRLGFTLVELMIVVAIISVLAVIAGTAYRRYMDSGRTAEVMSMLGEIRGREEAYKAEYAKYLNSDNGTETTFYPALLAKGKEPSAKTWNTGSQPQGWKDLGLNPSKYSLYCGYSVVSGAANAAATQTRGKAIFAAITNSTPTVAWWYAIGTCDNDSDGDSSHNAYFSTSSQTTSVNSENEHW